MSQAANETVLSAPVCKTSVNDDDSEVFQDAMEVVEDDFVGGTTAVPIPVQIIPNPNLLMLLYNASLTLKIRS